MRMLFEFLRLWWKSYLKLRLRRRLLRQIRHRLKTNRRM